MTFCILLYFALDGPAYFLTSKFSPPYLHMGYANIRTQTSKSMYRKKSAELHKSRYFEVCKPADCGREDYSLGSKR